MSTVNLLIDSLYKPSDEFDYEGGITTILHDQTFHMRVLPEGGTWDIWEPGQIIPSKIFLSLEDTVEKCEPFSPAQIYTISKNSWVYYIEGSVEGIDNGQAPFLSGFPEIELDPEILNEKGRSFIKDGFGLSFIGALWASSTYE